MTEDEKPSKLPSTGVKILEAKDASVAIASEKSEKKKDSKE